MCSAAPGSDSTFAFPPFPITAPPCIAISLPPPLLVSGAPAFSPPQLYSEPVGGGRREGAWRNRGSREHELQHHFRVSVRGGRGPPTASRPRPAGVSRAFRACECVGLSRAESACPRAPPRAPPSPRPLLVLPPHSAPSFPSKRRPSRALAQALAPPQPSPPGESRAAAAGARQALCSSPLPFSLGGRGRGGPRCDCMCVRPGTGSGCGGAGDGEEWGGLGGGCLSGGWQSSAPWRGKRDVPKKGL